MSADLVSVPLYRLGHGRSGDKGDISNLSLIAWDPECYAILAAQVSEARVAAWFASRHPRRVVRYLLPTLHAMNFVLENALDGGVNDALNLDAHGKSLSFRLLDMTVQVSPRWPPVCPIPATAQRPPDPPHKTHTGDTRCARPSGPGSPCCWRPPCRWPPRPSPSRQAHYLHRALRGRQRHRPDRARHRPGRHGTDRPGRGDREQARRQRDDRRAAARAAPDGYTVLITTNTTHAANQHLYKTLTYRPVEDYVPLTLLGKGGQIMVVNPNSAAKSVGDFIAQARQSPGKLSFGSGSSSSRIAGELLQQMANVQLLHVPYKSNPLAVTDLLGGQIDMMITDTATGLPQVKSGKLRALGVTGLARSPLAPEVPTIAQAGVPGYEMGYWFAAYAPAARRRTWPGA